MSALLRLFRRRRRPSWPADQDDWDAHCASAVRHLIEEIR